MTDSALFKSTWWPGRGGGGGPNAGCHTASGEVGLGRTISFGQPGPSGSGAHGWRVARSDEAAGLTCGPQPQCHVAWATDMQALTTVTGGGSLNLIRFQIQTDSKQVQIV
jgi:hypothetical protein